ncbi:ABC transporter permease [Microlunatus parietis]|uniref:Peptide/nickel transport system permease protein n=1 Tax=Microlunatus parietis TaxID=682979 RepID=A0A7Y9I786_9ACTN|nr:ABC transporter permease [Microlunatus parietis]NYE71335.1 peptide/nickel transport system permease protein [Microlunatus parietis]
MKYYLAKIGYFLLTVWAAITLNFFIPRLQPGDPAEQMVRKLQTTQGQDLDPAQVEAVRVMLGIPNTSLWEQYLAYFGQLARGDFGISFIYYPFPVMQVIGEALPWTIGLVGVTQILAFVIGVLLGAFAAWRRDGAFDSIVSLGSTFIGNLPGFWIGLLILSLLGFQLGWFPTQGGWGSYTEPGWNGLFIADVIAHSFLPALSLMVTAPIGFILGMRNTMVQTLGEDYIRLAQAAGLPERRIALGYGARNALLPSVTSFALSLGALIGGTVMIEAIYDFPGMGRLLADAANNRDYPLMQGALLLMILAVLLANLIADLLYGVLDPRARRAS